MAGAAYTTTVPKLLKFWDFLGEYPIKSAEILNQCDTANVDSNGQLVAAKAASTAIAGSGVVVFNDEHGGVSSRTGVAGLTVKASLYRRARIGNLNSTLVPSIAATGLPIYLAEAVPSATVTNYTAAQTTTNGSLVQVLGQIVDATTIDVKVDQAPIKFQTSATSTAILTG